MDQKNKLAIYDFSILILITILVKLIRPDFAFLAIFLALPAYLILTKRKQHIFTYIIAIIQAATWILIGNSQYGYNQEVLVLFGLNIYPFLLWSTGLFLVYIYAEHISRWLKIKKTWQQFLVYTIFFWFALITIETLSYHVFLIRNAATGMYAGLPICECIHAPVWMQIVYLSMGPINFIIQRLLLKLKKPRRTKSSAKI